jgi:hypothetical protein
LVYQGYATAITRPGPAESLGSRGQKMSTGMACEVAKKHATEHEVGERGAPLARWQFRKENPSRR